MRLCGEARWNHDQIKIYERNTVGIGKTDKANQKVFITDFIVKPGFGS